MAPGLGVRGIEPVRDIYLTQGEIRRPQRSTQRVPDHNYVLIEYPRTRCIDRLTTKSA